MKLRGIRVIDLSSFLPGPYLTSAMADHGAEVIKIEAPGGDPGRSIGSPDGDSTVFFRNVNRGKKSVVLDLKQESDREALLKLCETADVVVESFRPGVVDPARRRLRTSEGAQSRASSIARSAPSASTGRICAGRRTTSRSKP